MAKATAVRNIRDDHQKAFLKIFNSLCGPVQSVAGLAGFCDGDRH